VERLVDVLLDDGYVARLLAVADPRRGHDRLHVQSFVAAAEGEVGVGAALGLGVHHDLKSQPDKHLMQVQLPERGGQLPRLLGLEPSPQIKNCLGGLGVGKASKPLIEDAADVVEEPARGAVQELVVGLVWLPPPPIRAHFVGE
jgi:hypothetical protein